MKFGIDILHEMRYHNTGFHGTRILTEVKPLDRVNIEAERGRLQMTKTDMCKALDITLKTYNGYIKGAVIPSNVLEQLRQMTGRSIDYLLGLDTIQTST